MFFDISGGPSNSNTPSMRASISMTGGTATYANCFSKRPAFYLARYLKLKNLTLCVWTANFNKWASQTRRELDLALLIELSWITHLALVVRNMDIARVTVWGKEMGEVEKAITTCLESVIPGTSKTVRQCEAGLLDVEEKSEDNPSKSST